VKNDYLPPSGVDVGWGCKNIKKTIKLFFVG